MLRGVVLLGVVLCGVIGFSPGSHHNGSVLFASPSHYQRSTVSVVTVSF